MNLKSLQAELSKLQKRGKRLESQIKARAAKQFAALPGKVGLTSIDHLIGALIPYSSAYLRAKLAGKPSAGARATASAHASKSAGARLATAGRSKSSTRNRYSPAVKNAIRRELVKGGKTFNQLSKEYGPSVFSIKDWKKSWGLTKPRKKK